MKKKIIVSSVVISIVLFIGAFTAYSKISDVQSRSQTGMHSFNKTGEITFNTEDAFKNQRVKVKIDNSETEDEVGYVLKNPEGKVLMEGKVKPKEKLDMPEKVYEGKKGIWKFEVAKEENEDTTRVYYNFTSDDK